MEQRLLLAAAAILLLALPAAANPPPPPATGPEKELAGLLRGLLLNHIPDPLVEVSPGWGKQVPALVNPKQMRNQGAWRHIKVTALNPAQTLVVEVRNVCEPEPSKRTFDLLVGFDAQFDFNQQLWERGVRLYSGSTRARAKVFAALKCEVTSRSEGKGLLPDLVFRVRVTSAELKYSGVDVVHIAGLGGDPARWLGEALRSTLKELRPDLERELLARANTAIIKAGNNKEVRVSLGKLLKVGGK